MTYQSADGPRTVLYARLDEDAEAKLLDALDVGSNLVAKEVEQTVQGRVPLDEKNELAEKLISTAKSVNHHITNEDLTPGHAPATTVAKLDAAKAALSAVMDAAGENPGAAEVEMLQHYQNKLAALDHAVATATKIAQVQPFTYEGKTLATMMVPSTPADATSDHAVAALRDATRIKPTLDPETGEASWNGTERWTDVSAKEYAIELGDGFQAVYRPYSLNDPKTTEYSLRGRLEIVAPAGQGNGPELVNRLGQLHLANRPMSPEEGEHSYLNANVVAQNLAQNTSIQEARKTGDHLEDMVRQELFHERAHEAVGMTDAQLAHFAKELQLEAHTRALPAKVGVLRDAVAQATGFADGTALAASPGYDPTPRKVGGWFTWSRFDVGNAADKLASAAEGKSLVHASSPDGLRMMLKTGLLASSERRLTMGTKRSMGKSEDVDKLTGGASSVFLRVLKTPTSTEPHPRLIWDDPSRLLARTDYYGANADTFGVINPAKASEYSNGNPATRDPFKIAKFTNPSNEVMFGDGIDLLGPEGPSRISCGSETLRNELHSMLAAKGVTHIAGKPVGDVVVL
ncbi:MULTISPECIES: hypothetical protein [Amycolatopsis]|uniref:hypothetical protein n=1 Tax=Amycolatopsis TaxID=1813 RepID=UPI001F0ECC3F|nr:MULTISPECIES: hypothetical protein [Amycolatopsis]